MLNKACNNSTIMAATASVAELYSPLLLKIFFIHLIFMKKFSRQSR